jgi:hypothetical protein
MNQESTIVTHNVNRLTVRKNAVTPKANIPTEIKGMSDSMSSISKSLSAWQITYRVMRLTSQLLLHTGDKMKLYSGWHVTLDMEAGDQSNN